MNDATSIRHWMGLWDTYGKYEKARARSRILRDPDAYVAAITAERIGALPPWVRAVLTYMYDIENAVWNVYFRELMGAPTGGNPVVRAFLLDWKLDEGVHARILDRILALSGDPLPATRLVPWDSGRVARIFGERLFGGVHMTIGAINELMAGFAYRTLAAMVREDHPELAAILGHIAADESTHYSFYFRMAQGYLGASRLARRIALLATHVAARGVGVGVRPENEAYAVFEVLLAGREESFLEKVAMPIRGLEGMAGFTAMHRLLEKVFGKQRLASA